MRTNVRRSVRSELTAPFFVVRCEQSGLRHTAQRAARCACTMQALLRKPEDEPIEQWKPIEAARVSQRRQPDLQETDGCMTRTAVQEQHVQMFAGQQTADCMARSQNTFVASHPPAILQLKWLLNETALSVWLREVVCVWRIRSARSQEATQRA